MIRNPLAPLPCPSCWEFNCADGCACPLCWTGRGDEQSSSVRDWITFAPVLNSLTKADLTWTWRWMPNAGLPTTHWVSVTEGGAEAFTVTRSPITGTFVVQAFRLVTAATQTDPEDVELRHVTSLPQDQGGEVGNIIESHGGEQ